MEVSCVLCGRSQTVECVGSAKCECGSRLFSWRDGSEKKSTTLDHIGWGQRTSEAA